jgi:hypothetical protein
MRRKCWQIENCDKQEISLNVSAESEWITFLYSVAHHVARGMKF